MKKFETLALKILNESPVGVNSKQQWVSSILHRLSLNLPSTKLVYPSALLYHISVDADPEKPLKVIVLILG